eukprot:6746426-Alexandrium_andersonii.AAC.1
MSASLVGSEMCIRDRFLRCRWLGRLGWSDALAVGLGPDHRASQEHRKKAVSYTHLTLPTICSV